MIQTQQLAFRYPGGSGIRFPDVDLPQGGTLLLRGKSGSGKSTWLALCAGLLRPASGSLRVAGQNLNAIDSVAVDAWRSRAIGFLSQKLHLSPALDVWRNLALAYRHDGGDFTEAVHRCTGVGQDQALLRLGAFLHGADALVAVQRQLVGTVGRAHDDGL